MQHTIKKIPGSLVEINLSIPWETVATYEEKAITALSKNLEIDGFRKGTVPAAIAKKHIQENIRNEAMAEYAISEAFDTIRSNETIDSIGRPEVRITVLAPGNDLVCTITTAVLPTFELPEYKTITSEIKERESKTVPEVTEEDIAHTIKELQAMRAHQKAHDDGGHDEHDHSHGPIDEKDFPEVNEEFAKSFGFETLALLNEKIRENLSKEKIQKENERIRIALIEGVIDATTVEIPEILIESERTLMIERMKHDVASMGISFEEYLKHINKTEEDMRADFQVDAVKRVKMKLLVDAIAKKESLYPDAATVEKEAEALRSRYPDADPLQTKAYVEQVLTTENVLSFLEK